MVAKTPAERILYGEKQADGGTPYWTAPTLWAAANGRPRVSLMISDLKILDEVVWFGGPKDVQPTVRRVADRASDIFNADLSYPIIMTHSGEILDGAHRIARAYLEGRSTIEAAVLQDFPPPDGVSYEDGSINTDPKVQSC